MAAGDYLHVTKPGIILGNLIPAAAAFLLAARGHVDIGLLAATMAGLALVIAAACVANNCIDRDIDRRMRRTRGRALACGRMAPSAALAYAALLGAAGMALLLAGSNRLAAAVAAAGFLIYVGPYSLWLKRRSGAAVPVGALAGAAPPLAGYCAAAGGVDAGAVMLLAIFGFWQLPHFHAIAIYRLDDYVAAAIPVLPVRLGVAAAKRRLLGWVLAFWVAALLPGLAGYAGRGYLAAAALLGLGWLIAAWLACRSHDDRRWARRLFVCSLVAVCGLSLMMALDAAPLAATPAPSAASRPPSTT